MHRPKIQRIRSISRSEYEQKDTFMEVTKILTFTSKPVADEAMPTYTNTVIRYRNTVGECTTFAVVDFTRDTF